MSIGTDLVMLTCGGEIDEKSTAARKRLRSETAVSSVEAAECMSLGASGWAKENNLAIYRYSDALLRICQKAAALREEAKANGEWLSINPHDLPTIILRLYQQTTEDEDQDLHLKCLDMWDTMLKLRIGNAESELKKI